MRKLKLKELEAKANEIRIDVIKMITKAGSGHPAGALGMVDIMTALYFNILIHDPEKPDWEERDRLILSNGHICPVQYAALAEVGYFPLSKLETLRKLDSGLQGHPERTRLAGIETTSGPLGSGLAEAAGYAYAARMDEQRFRIFCLVSDGEHDEGNHWEGVLFAGKYRLPNLTVFVDRNNIQISGFTQDVLPLEPLAEKYRAFNWNVIEIDGHDFGEIIRAVDKARDEHEKPTVILAKTIPGKGVSFMEDKPQWHGKAPSQEEEKEALGELRARGREIKKESK